MANKPITLEEMKAYVDATWEKCQTEAWQESVRRQAVNNIRVRIMQEAYDLADRNDSEGYNSVKVMCSEVLGMINKLLDERQPEQEPIAWVYPEALAAFEKGDPWVAYGENGDGPYPDGVKRIPLYLHNDAVALRVEPRSGESGAGFESLPASPTWWHEPVARMNYRQWQGLTDAEREQFRQWAHPDIIEAIELRLQERNT